MHCSVLQADWKCPSVMNSNLIVIFLVLVIERLALHRDTWMFSAQRICNMPDTNNCAID